MSDNKINGSSGSSWGLSTLIEGAMGKDAAAKAEPSPVAPKERDGAGGDQFEDGAESVADEFLGWVGQGAKEVAGSASDLIDRGADSIATTVADLARGSAATNLAEPITTDSPRVRDRVESSVAALEEFLDADLKDVVTGGLNKVGASDSSIREVERKLGRIEHEAKQVFEPFDRGDLFTGGQRVASLGNRIYGTALEIMEEKIPEESPALDFAASFGARVEQFGEAINVIPLPATRHVGGLLLSAGAALETVGNAREEIAMARQDAREMQATIDMLDPSTLAANFETLSEGEVVVYDLGGKISEHAGLGGGVDGGLQLKLERKGGKLVGELKLSAKGSLGIGAELMGEGASVDLAADRGVTLGFECDDREALESLGGAIKRLALSNEMVTARDMPESFRFTKIGVDGGHAASAGVEITPLGSAGVEGGGGGSVSVVAGQPGESPYLLARESGHKADVNLSFAGVASGRTDKDALREQLINATHGEIGEVFESFDVQMLRDVQDVLSPQPGAALKVAVETKRVSFTPAEASGEAIIPEKIVFERKASLIAGKNQVEIENKVEIRDPVGLAKELGMSPTMLFAMLEGGDLGAFMADAVSDSDRFYEYVTVETKASHRFFDVEGPKMGGYTLTRTSMDPPVTILEIRRDKDGEHLSGEGKVGLSKIKRGVIEGAKAFEGPEHDEVDRPMSVMDYAQSVIKG